MLWLSWPTEEAIAPRFMPKPCTKADGDIVVDAVARDDRDLDDILVEVDPAAAPPAKGSVDGHALGDDLAGDDADRLGRRPLRRARRNRRAATRRALTLPRPTGASEPRVANRASSTEPPAGEDFRHRASVEIVDHDEIGAPARRDEAAIAEPENARRRNARRAIGGERRRAER